MTEHHHDASDSTAALRARAAADAATLRARYESPEILRVVNVWDAVSAKVISDLPGTTAIATAGHGIAASHGYADGEHIPFELMLASVARIVRATQLPVTADLDAGFGDAGESVRRAIGVGVSGANIEDQLRPLGEATAMMRAAVEAGEAEGVDFVLNARTDALIRSEGLSREASLAEAIERGRAYLEVGATCVFVPGIVTIEEAEQLARGIGERKVSLIGLPGTPSAAEYEAVGVARISYGPMPQNVALTALKLLGNSLYGDGVIPAFTERLNDF